MTSAPAVTVLMAVRNGAAVLPAAIRSIQAQTYRDLELLVIDDGSTDDTASVLRGVQDARVKIIRGPAVGLTKALNSGLTLARGRYVARMDADDVSHPERLARQITFLDSVPDVALCGTWARVVNERGHPLGLARPPVGDAEIRAQLLWDNAFFHSSWMVRTATIRGLGGYDEAIERAQDYDLAWRISRIARCANLPSPLLTWCRRAGSISVLHREAQRRSVGEIAYRALSGLMRGSLGADWFWRLRDLWDGSRFELPSNDGRRLAELIEVLPPAAGMTSWMDLIAMVASARRADALAILAAAWRRFPRSRRRLLHPKRIVRMAFGGTGLRLSVTLRRSLRGY